MATNNILNNSLSGQTGTGTFVGSNAPTIVTPTIQQIYDANNNVICDFQLVANAVNYIQIENNDTTNPPGIFAEGSDTNIGLTLQAKGTGLVNINTLASSQAFYFATGTGNLHLTYFTFANTATTNIMTWPDSSGTILISAGTNQMDSGASLLLNKGTGSVSAAAVTINAQSGVITTGALTTAQYATEVFTLTNSLISSSSVVLMSIMGGTNTIPGVTVSATAGSGTSTVTLMNTNTSALNGTVIIGFSIF